jgi:two-component system chemotaxis sensor kinase CheA
MGMDDLLQEFVAETRETLEALSGEIVAWEANPGDRARLDAIFRFVHTVKGSCGFLDLPRLARLSHAAEDVLGAVRDGQRTPDTALVNAVLAIVDRIGELVEAIDAGHALDDSSEDLLIAALAEDASPARPVVAAAASGFQRSASRSIRLNVDLLDRMMSGMSEMVLARNELARRLRDGQADPRADAALERLSLTVAEMRDAVTRTRMQRIEALFSALPRMVRDTAAELGKAVSLTIEGGDVELDREMIELLRDPLVHIIRNSVDHGIEAPAARRLVGKPETGRLTVSARQSGNQILVEIADDGAGIDVARVTAKAVKAGLHGQAEVATMSEAQRLDLIFAPGLSSRDTVTATSGRGVGMDVVRANIEQIGGKVSLANTPGSGLTLCMQVPLTLSIISTIIVGTGGQRFALPRQSIEEIVPLSGGAVRVDMVGAAPIATVRGERLGLVGLASVLGIEAGPATMLAIVITRSGRFALGIDAVLDVEELVVKPAAPAVMAGGLFAGQTLPDSGLPMLLLDGAGIAARAGLSFAVRAQVGEGAALVEAQGLAALLFDDLDGRRRAVALAAIDRVETVAAEAIHHVGGRLRLATGQSLVPLRHVGTLAGRREVVVLRLSDGEREVGYAIDEPLDIVSLPTERAAGAADEAIAGVAMIDGLPVELVDAHTLFAAEIAARPAAPPLCLLHADGDGWMSGFLRPTLEAAGYRCVTWLAPGERPALALAMADAPPLAGSDDVPIVTLSRDAAPQGTGIYRYDRERLVAAMAARVAGGVR